MVPACVVWRDAEAFDTVFLQVRVWRWMEDRAERRRLPAAAAGGAAGGR